MTIVDEIRSCTTIAKLNSIYVESHRQYNKLKVELSEKNISVLPLDQQAEEVKKIVYEMMLLDNVCKLTELREHEIKKELLRGK